MKWIQEKIRRFLEGRYGLDELGKVLIWAGLIVYVLGMLLQNVLLMFIAFLVLFMFVYRCMSRQTYERNDENRRFLRYVKLWKLKYEYRKSARIYMCPRCGKFIRVPKGKGKIQVTCKNCGATMIKRT